MGRNEPQRDLGIQVTVTCNGDNNNEVRPGQGVTSACCWEPLVMAGCDEKCCYHLLQPFYGGLFGLNFFFNFVTLMPH